MSSGSPSGPSPPVLKEHLWRLVEWVFMGFVSLRVERCISHVFLTSC